MDDDLEWAETLRPQTPSWLCDRAVGVFALAALVGGIGLLSGASAQPLLGRNAPSATEPAITALGAPVSVAVTLHRRFDAAWFMGGMIAIGTITNVVCKPPDAAVVPYSGAACILSVTVLAIAGITALFVGLIHSAESELLAWLVDHPANHPSDGQWRWIGALDKGGSAKGHVYHMHDKQAGLRGIRASIQLDAPHGPERRGDEPRQSGDSNGLHLDYVWRDDDQGIEHRLAHHRNFEHELDQAFADAVSRRPDIAKHEGYFCADIFAAATTRAATQGAFFVTRAASYPYQPGQSTAVVSGCHYHA